MLKIMLNPDLADKSFSLGHGEFSIRTCESFNRHLTKLHKVMQKIPKEFKSGEITEEKLSHIRRYIFREASLWF